jgi:hypothetical protein
MAAVMTMTTTAMTSVMRTAMMTSAAWAALCVSV